MNSKSYEKSKYHQLRNAKSLNDLAKVLGFSPSGLSYVLYVMGKKDDVVRYDIFDIKKKNGGVRKIKAPASQLKELQKRLSDLLYVCLQEINKKIGTDKEANKQKKARQSVSFAYQPNQSHFDNAKVHRRKRYVFNIDLKDFFDSINFGRVRGYFINNDYFKLDPNIATIIAQIGCDENALPQGSPSSPIISHFIASILDYRLSKLAKQAKCHYSRYCDDITFSTNQKEFPKLIAELENGIWRASDELIDVIEHAGFKINDEKVRMSYQPNRQSVTGLVVNKRVNTYRKYRDTVRALVHTLVTKGDFVFCGEFAKDKRTEENKFDCLQGMLCYIRHIDRQSMDNYTDKPNRNNKQNKHKHHKELKNFKVFRDFVLYRYFFANDKVVVFGEGKTDALHLKYYLKHRENNQQGTTKTLNNLAEWKKFSLKKFESRIFDPISESGGTGDIKNLISNYQKYCKKFLVPINQNPVIILVDNDQGSGHIFSQLNKSKKQKQKDNESNNSNKSVTKADDLEEFYHIAHNLYIVALPKLNNRDTAIEDFYGDSIRSMVHENKTFSSSNNYDSTKYYGKNAFAKKIIPNNIEQVDWSNFDQIFERIQAAIDDFRARQSNSGVLG